MGSYDLKKTTPLQCPPLQSQQLRRLSLPLPESGRRSPTCRAAPSFPGTASSPCPPTLCRGPGSQWPKVASVPTCSFRVTETKLQPEAGAGDETQGLGPAKQRLYQLNYWPGPAQLLHIKADYSLAVRATDFGPSTPVAADLIPGIWTQLRPFGRLRKGKQELKASLGCKRSILKQQQGQALLHSIIHRARKQNSPVHQCLKGWRKHGLISQWHVLEPQLLRRIGQELIPEVQGQPGPRRKTTS
ncbi:uncharacterized protein LOC132653244 [Meriones unguiculatus]|uniref:uncharacterized protein LOC132653244 n=1 Tax=Meriones unguiculatus TaxID=10047 RepID=UPI00293F16A6|nr:uncharacterized protein LOC132653244 [Meriones unguiculatus]